MEEGALSYPGNISLAWKLAAGGLSAPAPGSRHHPLLYRARDSRLGRDVAIKVLPASDAQDPEWLSRFRREAKVLASINHTNIAAIYGVEESNQVNALVLEEHSRG